MKKYIWIIIIIIGIVAFLFWKKAQANKPPETIKAAPPANLKALPMEPEKVPEWPLKKGDRGEKIRTLQKQLNSKFSAAITPTGIFDAATEAALAKAGFQKTVDEKDFYLIQTTSLAQAHKMKMKKK